MNSLDILVVKRQGLLPPLTLFERDTVFVFHFSFMTSLNEVSVSGGFSHDHLQIRKPYN